MTDALQPLLRHSRGFWLTDCGRFVIRRRRDGWRVTANLSPLPEDLASWLKHEDLIDARFTRRRDAVAALQAHLAVSRCPLAPVPCLSWTKTSTDTWHSSGGWIITRRDTTYYVSKRAEHIYQITRTRRSAARLAAALQANSTPTSDRTQRAFVASVAQGPASPLPHTSDVTRRTSRISSA